MTEEELAILQGKVDAIIDMWTGRQVDTVDGEKLSKFIDKYAVLNTIIENNTINELIANIMSVSRRFNDVSARIDGLLGSIEVESEKLVSNMGDGASGVALNVADMVMFQASVSDAYQAMMQHLSDIDITGKINRMESALREGMGLINSMRSQKEQIGILLQKIADNKALIDNMDEVNQEQQQLIDNAQSMIAEVEKQIENYAFYSEEFDKVYSTAVTFVSRFTEIIDELERVSARDDNLESLMAAVISLSEQDFMDLESLVSSINTKIDSLALNTAQKLDDMMLFVEEYNAVGTAMHSFKERMNAVSSSVGDKINEMDAATIGYGA